jgi:ERCC4-type nuclease
MSVVLNIDHRETKLKELIPSNPSIVYNMLEFGDIQLTVGNNVHFIFERKSIADLIASIKDGRYKNQKVKLMTMFQPSQVCYIIEGGVKWGTGTQNDKMVQGAIIGMLLRDKFGVIQTKTPQDTANFLVGVLERVTKEPEKYISQQDIKPVVVTDLKVADATPKDCYLHMLCVIPDVSDKTAEGIIQKFPTFSILFRELFGKTLEEQIKMFDSVKIGNPSRKISQKAVLNIIKYLLD